MGARKTRHMDRDTERRYGIKYAIEGFSHAQAYPQGNLYHAVRQLHDETLTGMARKFGTTRRRWQYREQAKKTYRVAEIMALYEASELTPEQFIKLLSKIA